MINKKGQLDSLFTGVTVIAACGILLAIMLYVIFSMGTSFKQINTPAQAYNETGSTYNSDSYHAWLNATGYILQKTGDAGFNAPTITAIINRTSNVGTVLVNGNYSVTSSGVVYNASPQTWNNVSISYTYLYTADTQSSNATVTITSQWVTFLPWLGIILLVLAAGTVLFLVIRYFSSTKGV
jgi:hypothetical protein